MEFDLFLPPALEPVTDVFFKITAYDESDERIPQGSKAIISPPDTRETPVLRVLRGTEGGDLSSDSHTKRALSHQCSLDGEHVTAWYWDSLDIFIADDRPVDALVWPYDEDSGGPYLLMKDELGSELQMRFRGLKLSSNIRGVAPVDSLWNLPGWLGHRRFGWREFSLDEPLMPLAHR